MVSEEFNVLEAIRLAQEAEQKAAAFYDDAAQKVKHPLGQSLLKELAEFERHHYAKLVALEESLRKRGAFIEYEGREIATKPPSPGEITVDRQPTQAMEVVALALEAEQQAEKRYDTLAERTSDPVAHEMFRRLADEEHTHYRILRDVYWNLNNRRAWVWAV
ncbi:MAG: ferritin family protein [Anaerolineae bacterium]|nr:ferritin family protein [Anaerolineae bacterium]